MTKIGSIILFFNIIFLFTNCGDKKSYVAGGNLIIDVDKHLQTTLSANEKLKTPLTTGVSPTEYLVINDKIIADFKEESRDKKEFNDDIGNGVLWSFTGIYAGEKLKIKKKLTIKVYDAFPDVAFFNVSYLNLGLQDVYIQKWVNNHYKFISSADTLFWSFQGESTEDRADWILPVKQGFYQQNYMGMNNTDYGGGIPVSDLWRRDIGIAVGHTSLHPELLSIPVKMDNNDFAELWLENSGAKLKTAETLVVPETFVMLHHGDVFNVLRKYSDFMQKKGITFPKSPPDAYEPIWCAWGYERKFTMDEIVGTLPKVKELGIKWTVIDDGYQKGEGDWNVNTKRFPAGNTAMKNLVQNIHNQGLKAKLWWAPLALDPCTPLWNNYYDDILLLNEDTSPRFITWWNAYYMSPVADITINETKKVLNLFFDEWGFDGLKMDGQHMNAVPPDYNERHHLDDPREAPWKLPEFFKMVYSQSMQKKENAVIENCPCGCCVSFYNLQGMNQAVSSDPLSSWQIRLKGKVYHAINPYLAYYGDHVELSDNGDDFASSFGVGAVLGTKFTWPQDNPYAEASYLLTPEKEKIWKKWFGLYNKLMLSKGKYIGGLYDIGFDKPETHVIEKNDTLFYAFYDDNWTGDISLKGLNNSVKYVVKDYENNKIIDTVSGEIPSLKTSFDNHLLIEVYPVK